MHRSLLVLAILFLSAAALAEDRDDYGAAINGSTEVATKADEAARYKTKTQVRAERRALFEQKLSLALDSLTPEAQVLLVWFTANDCPYCVKWERGLKENTSQQRYAKSEAAQWILMSVVRKRSLSDDFKARDFDDQIQFIKNDRFRNGYVKGVQAFPWFAVYVDQQSVMESSFWDGDILPALNKLWKKHQKLAKSTE